jgi:flagellar M-ring protein FliF
VLSAPGDSFGAAVDTQNQQVQAFENRMSGSVQAMLDRVLGTGNSTVQVTAELNFDQTVTNTTRYFSDPETPPLSDTSTTETYSAPGADPAGGVVGPDGQLDPDAPGPDGTTDYRKKTRTSDNAVNKEVEQREAAPGDVESLHVGIVLDTESAKGVDAAAIEDLVVSGLGIDKRRGDSVEVSVMPFDRTAEKAAADDLAAADAAAEKAQLMSWAKTGGLALLVLLILLLAYLRGRRRNKAREQATTYMVEQLRRDAVDRANQPEIDTPPAAALALEVHDPVPSTDMTAEMREEIAAMVERQPEDVAQLLRGWLVERGS